MHTEKYYEVSEEQGWLLAYCIDEALLTDKAYFVKTITYACYPNVSRVCPFSVLLLLRLLRPPRLRALGFE